VDLNARHTLILAILVIFLGHWLSGRVRFLREYGIPDPVSGGIVASLALTLLTVATGADFRFDLSSRDTLLVAFFTTIGLSANLRLLAHGGTMLAVLTACAITNLVMQNAIGVGLATVFGLPPAAGLLAGSAALSGGHGTVLAWSPIIAAKFGVANAAAVGAAAATFGLVAGGVLGGPLGHWLIARHRLSASDAAPLTVGVAYADENKPQLDARGMLATLLVIATAMAAADEIEHRLAIVGFPLPRFVCALFAGMVLSNTVPRLAPRLGWPTGSPPLALISEVALGLFLAMSLMTLNLASLAGADLPLLAILAAQVVACWLVLSLLVFRLLGGT
jgi:ESS family glutamate:Na+ symporter